MEQISPKSAPNGMSYLNIGCGNVYSMEWNNLDFIRKPGIVRWDIRKGLPYPDSSLDAAYSSHVFEHLTPLQAKKLMSEICRALKPGGIIRIAVPDLERVCKEYLACLDSAEREPSDKNSKRYDWMMLELIDQMVREKPGGLLREAIDSGDFDMEYAQSRIGDLSRSGKAQAGQDSKFKAGLKKIRHYILKVAGSSNDPRKSGEVHRWMYDRFSLKRLLASHGFEGVRVMAFDASAIPDWGRYNLDASKFDPKKAKKPESIYIEGRKKQP